jgi:CRP-like cAMP-binding protein
LLFIEPGEPAPAAGGPARRVQIFNSSESYSPDQSRQLAVFAKPEAAKVFLRGAISQHYLFESLGDEDVNRIIDCMRPTFASTDETIIKQGELGDLFFCLESGSASAFIDGKEVMKYASGGCFGELALIYNSPRGATVTATSPCKLWTLDLR